MCNQARPPKLSSKVVLLAFVGACALVPASSTLALAQDFTEAGLGTSWFPVTATAKVEGYSGRLTLATPDAPEPVETNGIIEIPGRSVAVVFAGQ